MRTPRSTASTGASRMRTRCSATALAGSGTLRRSHRAARRCRFAASRRCNDAFASTKRLCQLAFASCFRRAAPPRRARSSPRCSEAPSRRCEARFLHLGPSRSRRSDALNEAIERWRARQLRLTQGVETECLWPADRGCRCAEGRATRACMAIGRRACHSRIRSRCGRPRWSVPIGRTQISSRTLARRHQRVSSRTVYALTRAGTIDLVDCAWASRSPAVSIRVETLSRREREVYELVCAGSRTAR